MARGARRRAGADYAIGITGIAGPDGGSEQKRVGLVCISVDHGSGTATSCHTFPGDRSVVRARAAHTALNALRLLMES
jgi:nicotinamide-nucleotide amidase